ncbi:TonB-dependent receptor domain-containing protein [Sphingobacterium hotanense]|uniref:TonB-dependent receptor domain-containing protein n=1 Tax=Sphingobacterium TaxID=28453 RepID=UPI0021A89076|nr:TonB-dependent receptor [Sphingobacterium hotanense]MCT1523677.1 TonB-dependent receptor [Sphingobacterium hotanense]
MNIGNFIYLKEFFSTSCRRKLSALSLLMVVLSQSLCANAAMAQILDRRVSVHISTSNVTEGLAALGKNAQCQINYDRSIFASNTKVRLDANNITLAQALKRMLNGTRIGFKESGRNTVILYRLPDPQKPGRITGKVVDDKGGPLVGASIRIVGTDQAMQSGTDGGYGLSIAPGTYVVEISYISFQTQRITGVVVKENGNTPLTVALKQEPNTLQQVVITSGYKKASVSGLLAQQKNAAALTNGISAEQIGATPDKNIGESLKRISGVSSIENKFVLVRGIGERYNAATLDGTLLPSTEAQNRSFSFDMIPSNLVDNVIVNKTVTPDMNASFGGGLIQINTKDIPNQNFTSFTAGVSYNDQSTGKDFLSHKPGKYDYLGFDDGRRNFPKDLFSVSGMDFTQESDKITEQSKRFTNDNFTVYERPAAPSQNYQFTIGRIFTLDTTSRSADKFGFTGSISYRNNQNINHIDETRRGSWDDFSTNTARAYSFNTTWGGLLNMGLQLGKHRFSFRNTYTHIFDNTLVRGMGYNDNMPNMPAQTGMQKPNLIEEADDPTFTTLLQNKLAGQHQLDKVKLEWEFARTAVNRKEKDLGIAQQILRKIGSEYEYFYNYAGFSEPRIKPTSRQDYSNSEKHYSWNVAGTLPFELGSVRNTVKLGYFGVSKNAKFDWRIVSLAAAPLSTIKDSLLYLPIREAIRPENMGAEGFQFMPWYLDYYEGKSQNHAGYLMLDNRLTDQLRLVWGVRAEYYEYKEVNNASNGKNGEFGSIFNIKPDKKWQWMPSASLTYSPLSSLNLRAGYSSSIVRPEMMDNSQFFRYSAYYGGMYGSDGLYSTRIDSWDIKAEWFPGLGEILSVGGFYKNFDKPAELSYRFSVSGDYNYILKSSDWAKVYGLEFELRKSLGFIYDTDIMNNLSAYGNVTLQKSEVKATYLVTDENDPDGGQIEASMKENRSMYGQTPFMMNAGLQYAGGRFGMNVVYNKIGLRTFMVSDSPEATEYEQPREQLDAQISYRFFGKRLEVKLNAGNILNSASTIYRNFGSYERNPDYQFDGDISNAQRLKEGFTDKYEEGDMIMFKQYFGRTFSTSLTYSF